MINKPTKKICFYHFNCFDGAFAALAVWKEHPDVEFVAIDYQNDMVVPEGIDDAMVMIVDFSFTTEVMDEIFKRAWMVTFLDHHPRTKEYLFDLINSERYKTWLDGEEVEAHCSVSEDRNHLVVSLTRAVIPESEEDQVADARTWVLCEYDLNRSGAQLAWDLISLTPSSIPEIIKYVSDYDRYVFELEHTREVIYGLGQYDVDLEVYKTILDEKDLIQRLIKDAPVVRSVRQGLIANTIRTTQRIVNFAEHFVPLLNCPKTLTSEALASLYDKYDFAVSYYDTPTHRNISLRSRKGGLAVNEIAKMYGGNGHVNAAGINVPRDTKDPHLQYLLSL